MIMEKNSRSRQLGPKGQGTRLKLLAALESELADRPLHQIKVMDVARRAITSSATFYEYFPSLDEALNVLLDDLVEEYRLRVAEIRLRVADLPPGGQVFAQVDGFFEFFAKHTVVLGAVGSLVVQGDETTRGRLAPLVAALAGELGRHAGSPLPGSPQGQALDCLAWYLVGVALMFGPLFLVGHWASVSSVARSLAVQSVSDLAGL